jgi:hypothetical protein
MPDPSTAALVLRAAGDLSNALTNTLAGAVHLTYSRPVSAPPVVNLVSFYVWRTTGGRLTLNLGFRLAFDRGFIREQSKEAGQFASIYPAASYPKLDVTSWNTFVPRLRATYQLTSDGRTVIKGGWGRFAAIRGTDEANYVNRNIVGSTTFFWHDTNANGIYEPGEANLSTANNPDFVSQTGTTQGIHNPDERAPISDEFSASIERQLFNDFAVRVTGL